MRVFVSAATSFMGKAIVARLRELAAADAAAEPLELVGTAPDADNAEDSGLDSVIEVSVWMQHMLWCGSTAPSCAW